MTFRIVRSFFVVLRSLLIVIVVVVVRCHVVVIIVVGVIIIIIVVVVIIRDRILSDNNDQIEPNNDEGRESRVVTSVFVAIADQAPTSPSTTNDYARRATEPIRFVNRVREEVIIVESIVDKTPKVDRFAYD